MLNNKKFLENTTGMPVSMLAYPYGNYNNETIAEAFAAGFDVAFTTEEKVIKSGDNNYRLGRFQVQNIGGVVFKNKLKKWLMQ